MRFSATLIQWEALSCRQKFNRKNKECESFRSQLLCSPTSASFLDQRFNSSGRKEMNQSFLTTFQHRKVIMYFLYVATFFLPLEWPKLTVQSSRFRFCPPGVSSRVRTRSALARRCVQCASLPYSLHQRLSLEIS